MFDHLARLRLSLAELWCYHLSYGGCSSSALFQHNWENVGLNGKGKMRHAVALVALTENDAKA